MMGIPTISRRCLPMCLLAALAGCGSNVAGIVGDMNAANINRLSNLYTAYQKQHGWHGPKDEAALKSFITTEMHPDKLKLMGVDRSAVDLCFVSERDGQPFKVKYGVKGGFRVVAPVVFEAVGVDGLRQIGSTNSVKPEEADAARYDKLWKQESAPPAPREPWQTS